MPMRARDTGRRLLALAVPAFGALIAEPLFVITDTAMVGHLGSDALAGLGIGANLLQTIVGLMVFLAYTTTPAVARRLGAGDRAGAIGLPLAHPAIALFTADPLVRDAAGIYLTISLFGLPGMLLVIAATGLLRGLQDTRTPLAVAVGGAIANALLNGALIYGPEILSRTGLFSGTGLGIAGSALGTAIAQTGMAACYLAVVARACRREGVTMRFALATDAASLGASGFMILRTLTLRASLILFVWSAARLGVAEVAALQVVITVYNLIAFALDALAIAAQALIGHDLGAGDTDSVREVVGIAVRWGIAIGVILGVAIAASSSWLPMLFTADAQVRSLAVAGFCAMAAGLPLCGYVFVLDGVLIGAGDARYLALVGLVPLVAFAGALAAVLAIGPHGVAAAIALWAAFGATFMGGRALVLGLRARGDAWMRVGA